MTPFLTEALIVVGLLTGGTTLAAGSVWLAGLRSEPLSRPVDQRC
jgi:hypothetical protein